MSDGQGSRGEGGDDGREEPRSPLAQMWDIARYAPVGLLMEGPYLLPKLAEMGKVHVRNARVVGELAVRQGRQELRTRLEGLELDEQAAGLLRLVGVLPDAEPDGAAPDDAVREPREPDGPARGTGAVGAGSATPGAPSVGAALPSAEPDTSGPAAGELAIPDYESLSAPQVVSRLPGLSPDELEAVRAFETGHRGRKTILGKIAQLREG